MTGLTIKGTHGTKVENREKIENYGFRRSEGLLGTGVYLWKDSDYAFDLAKAWVRNNNALFQPQQGIVFKCKVCLEDEDDRVDVDDVEIEEEVLNIIQQAGWPADKVWSVCKAYDRILEKYEEKRSRPILVVEGRTPQPPKFNRINGKGNYDKEYPGLVLKAPICYAVLKSDIIKREEVVSF